MDKQNVVYTYPKTLFSHKKYDILMYAITWMGLENIILGDISQTQKDKCCMIPLYEVHRISKFTETPHRIEVTGLGERQEWGDIV